MGKLNYISKGRKQVLRKERFINITGHIDIAELTLRINTTVNFHLGK